MTRWILGAVLVAHGIAHGVGVAGSLMGVELEGAVAAPTIDVGAAERAVAALFLVGLIAFVGAGVGLVARRAWWRPLTLAAAAVSMVPVAVWWEAASVGAYLNAAAVVAVLAARWIPGLTWAPAAPHVPAVVPPTPADRHLEGSPR
jgi:hypothetical protein